MKNTTFSHDEQKWADLHPDNFEDKKLYIHGEWCYYGKRQITTDEYNCLTYKVNTKQVKQ